MKLLLYFCSSIHYEINTRRNGRSGATDAQTPVDKIQIKASGGIKNYTFANQLVDAGQRIPLTWARVKCRLYIYQKK